MSSLILLPENIIEYIYSYLTFKQRISLLSCSKYLRKYHLKKIVKHRLNYSDSMSFILSDKYHNSILKKIYKKNICLNLSDIHLKISLNNELKSKKKYFIQLRNQKSINLRLISKVSLNNELKNIFTKKHFNKLCNTNTINLEFVYNKYIFINDLLQLFNIQTLILTCDNNADKNELIENLHNLHNKNNIKKIIIEVTKENDYKEILICHKDYIKQFIGESYQAYEKEVNNEYNSIEEYLSLCNKDFNDLIIYLNQTKDEYLEDLDLEYNAYIRGDPYYRENIKYEDKKNKFLW